MIKNIKIKLRWRNRIFAGRAGLRSGFGVGGFGAAATGFLAAGFLAAGGFATGFDVLSAGFGVLISVIVAFYTTYQLQMNDINCT